jgi:2-polyprenyl-3-methyl-5-hydroxy-6-metoxy-1,4-benzoquinol methylase
MAREEYRLRKMGRMVAGRSRILDLGCADLPNPFLLGDEVIGLDLATPGIQTLPPVPPTPRVPPNYVRVLHGDAMNLPEPFEPESFDAITAGELIEHFERPLDFLRACHATLKPDGLLVLSTPNPNSLLERLLTLKLSQRFFYTPHHVTLYPQRWLIRMLTIAGYSEIRICSGGFPVPAIGLVPFPRPWCYQTIAVAWKHPLDGVQQGCK